MTDTFHRHYNFSAPLDDMWEAIPEEGWSFETAPGQARLFNTTAGNAMIYLRPCSGYGDAVELTLVSGAPRRGRFCLGFIAGFEKIEAHLDLDDGRLEIHTHEYHKPQPRFAGQVSSGFSKVTVTREEDALPGLPYEGSRIKVFLDADCVATVGQIDYLPESFVKFGLEGPGELAFSSVQISGPPRPRPEYTIVGIWQQSKQLKTHESVDALLTGVRRGADAGVDLLVTPETSLTGLRDTDPELSNRDLIQTELRRFQDGVAGIAGAPHTLIGYPEWIDGSEVEGATLDRVKVNCHRFVRPDGSLGPMMAKVHSCEQGLWHGRSYNLQRVCGVEVAVGVCHDGHYQDVWATGVMGGARLCLHPAAGGNLTGSIPFILDSYRSLGTALCAYWVRVNAGGGSAIMYPTRNRKVPDTVLAVPPDLTDKSPTYPEYSNLGNVFGCARIRLWEADGAYPMRTLRSGRTGFEKWHSLVPPVVQV